jgi:uncharacterized protein (DUF433 family)
VVHLALQSRCLSFKIIGMNAEALLEHIWIDPARCGGRPCIRGHRIWVSMVLDLLAEGLTAEEIMKEHYPQITLEDIHACIAYGSAMSQERYVSVALEEVV